MQVHGTHVTGAAARNIHYRHSNTVTRSIRQLVHDFVWYNKRHYRKSLQLLLWECGLWGTVAKYFIVIYEVFHRSVSFQDFAVIYSKHDHVTLAALTRNLWLRSMSIFQMLSQDHTVADVQHVILSTCTETYRYTMVWALSEWRHQHGAQSYVRALVVKINAYRGITKLHCTWYNTKWPKWDMFITHTGAAKMQTITWATAFMATKSNRCILYSATTLCNKDKPEKVRLIDFTVNENKTKQSHSNQFKF